MDKWDLSLEKDGNGAWARVNAHTLWLGRICIPGLKPALMTVVMVLIAVLEPGCSKDGTDAVMREATRSDVNGYIGPDGHRFYTGKGVFAEKCPKTGSFDIEPVVAYVGKNWKPGDTNYMIAPQKLGAIKAPWNGEVLNNIVLPDAGQLEEWGAVEAKKEEVLVNP